jgi:ElaB/YqjD/DUF883 family membrane-anchored ribosome-binding protein
MTKSLAGKVKHELDQTLEDVAATLRQSADGLSDDAEKAIIQATQALRQAAQALADHTPPEARDLAKNVIDEAKAHPVATAAAALSAAAALITMIGLGRRKF